LVKDEVTSKRKRKRRGKVSPVHLAGGIKGSPPLKKKKKRADKKKKNLVEEYLKIPQQSLFGWD